MYIDSISGASLRLSWFISNSYSKSEMARRPLTTAVAPFSCAKSTSRLEKTWTSTFSELGQRLIEERLALLGREQRLLLADRLVDDPDDHPLEHPRGPGDDVDVAVGDRVVATRADRRRVAFLGAQSRLLRPYPHAHQGLTVGALARQRQRQLQRRLGGSATNTSTPRGKGVVQRLVEVIAECARGRGHRAGRRVRDRKLDSRCAVAATAGRRSAPPRRDRPTPASSTLRLRQRRDPSRPGPHSPPPRESASSPSAPVPQKRSRTRTPADVAQNREHGLAHPLGRRAHPRSLGEGPRAAAPAARRR